MAFRQNQGSYPPYQGASKIAPVTKGGTGSTTTDAAVDTLGGIHKSKIGVVGGLVQTDSTGKIPAELVADQTSFGYSVDGPLSLVYNGIGDYFITNFSIHRPLVVSVDVGSVEVIERDTIRIRAPATGDYLTLTLGSRTIKIPLSDPGPAKPSLTNIVGNNPSLTRVFYGTEFRGEPLSASVWYSTSEGTNTIGVPEGSYMIELRGGAGSAGEASIIMSGKKYSCGVASINRRVVLVPGSGINTIVTGTGHLEYRFLSSSFTHTATDWEIATDMSFSNIVASSYNDTVNKLSWIATLPVGDYFMRFRYHGSND